MLIEVGGYRWDNSLEDWYLKECGGSTWEGARAEGCFEWNGDWKR